MSLVREKVIDFKKALQFPIGEVSLNLCNPDGCMQKTNKGKLSQMVMKETDKTETLEVKKEHTAYIVHFMALIRMITKIPDTFERLAWKMVSYIPKDYGRIDFVADCYFENSIKASERLKRGISTKVIIKASERLKHGLSTKVIIKSSKFKIPRDFSSSFLLIGENKTRLRELIFQIMEEEKDEILDLLQSEEIVISREGC